MWHTTCCPLSIDTAIEQVSPTLQLALQLLVLFYIIKQQLHTPSLNSVFITTLGVYHTLGSNKSHYSMKECAIIVYNNIKVQARSLFKSEGIALP